MSRNRFLQLGVYVALIMGTLTAMGASPADFRAREHTASSGFRLKYRLLVPESYDASKSYPVVVFFHGGLQRLEEKWERATRTGAMFCGSDARQARHPCFVVVPWSSPEMNWGSVFEGGPSQSTLATIEVLDLLEKEFNIDKRREYVTGLSGGGKGTWISFLSHPGRFAAAIPICARQAVDPTMADLTERARLAGDLPIWMWHGGKDPKNDPENSRKMYAALKSVGANVRYTEVPDAPHNCWDTAYGSDELHEWLFSHRLPEDIAVDAQSRAERRDAVAALNPWTNEKNPADRNRADPARRVRRGSRGAAANSAARIGAEISGAERSGTQKWTAHGFNEVQRETIRNAFQAGIDGGAIPGGSLMIVHRGEVIFREGFGVADLESKQPFSVDAPCRIASLTKPHSATVLAILADREMLSLDDPIDKYLPKFAGVEVRGKGPASRRPTIAECLSHTAGFPGNRALQSGSFELLRDGTLAEVIADLANKPLAREPGSDFAYTELGFMTAGRIVEVISGKDFNDVMQEVLLRPIGATESTFYPSPEVQSRMPTAYLRGADGLRRHDGERMFTALDPGARLTATLNGVARVLLLHRNRGEVKGRRIVSAEALARMYVSQPGTKGTGYGLGFNTRKKRADGTTSRVVHVGASGTLGMIDFDQDLIVVIFSQVGRQDIRWRQRVLQEIDAIFGS